MQFIRKALWKRRHLKQLAHSAYSKESDALYFEHVILPSIQKLIATEERDRDLNLGRIKTMENDTEYNARQTKKELEGLVDVENAQIERHKNQLETLGNQMRQLRSEAKELWERHNFAKLFF